MQRAWWKESIVYQIYPRSFCDSNGDGIGDLKGITSKLDYLQLLGVDVIWLSPINKSPNCDNGYDISDYRDIMDEFGTLSDFDELLESAHKRGLRVMMDLVVNHTSDEHPWFVESKKGPDNPYRDYYIWKEGKPDGSPPNNWESYFSGPSWTKDERSGMWYLHLFHEKQPDLNWENPEVRREVFEMMTWWFEKGVDGFRMDTINMISKVPGLPDGEPIPGTPYGERRPGYINGPRVHEYLHEMNTEVLSKFDCITVGETPDTPVDEAAKFTDQSRGELHMLFQFEHMYVDTVNGMKYCDIPLDLVKLKEIMSRWQIGLHDRGWNSLYWNNHDQPRIVSRFGNDREYWEESAKMLATCLHMMEGTPYIYQGEEIGMVNMHFDRVEELNDVEAIGAYWEHTKNRGVDPKDMMRYINRIGRDNARTPMQWDDSDNAGFTSGEPWLVVNPSYKKINVAGQINDESSILSYYRSLIRLRKQHDIIVYGDYRLLLPEDKNIFAYERSLDGKRLLCVCSFADSETRFPVPEDFPLDEATLLIANYEACGGGKELELRPFEARVYLLG